MATALATLAQVKEYLAITSTNDDALITRLIDVTSTSIEKWCSRTFGLGSYTVTLDGNGKQYLVLDQFPVTGVSSIYIDDQAIPQSTGVTVGGFFFTAPYKVQLRGQYRFTRGEQNVVVSYSAGYSVVPADIVQVCIKLVALRYKERDRLGLDSKNIGGETISFRNDDFPPSIERVLNEYRSVIAL